VAETVQLRNVWRGLRDAALTDFAGLADFWRRIANGSDRCIDDTPRSLPFIA
jgi:hypothetical protein